MRKVLTCALLVFPLIAHAADLKILEAKLAKPPIQIYVEFDAPLAITDCDVEYPSRQPTCSAPTNPWIVVMYDASAHASQIPVTLAIDSRGHFQAHGTLTLTLANPIPADAIRVDITFNKQNRPYVSIETKPKPASSAADTPTPATKDNSSVYLSGTFAPASGSTPDYSTDSKVNLPFKQFGDNKSYTASLLATVQTDSKGTADPDGFSWGIPIQRFSEHPYTVQWSVVGMELDKRGNAVNFVSAPSIKGALRHVFFTPDSKHAGTVRVAASVGLDLTAGVEFGSNLRDEFTAANKPGQTEGAFFRGVPSATAYLLIPQVGHLKNFTLNSSYTARIPTTDELFIETRNTKTPIPMLTSQTRNWIQNTLQFEITPHVTIQIKHQYGSIPPAFSFVQNSGSIGLVYSLPAKSTKAKTKSP